MQYCLNLLTIVYPRCTLEVPDSRERGAPHQGRPPSPGRDAREHQAAKTLGSEAHGSVSWDFDSFLGHDTGRGLRALYEKVPG